jgi:hypothetical protein
VLFFCLHRWFVLYRQKQSLPPLSSHVDCFSLLF